MGILTSCGDGGAQGEAFWHLHGYGLEVSFLAACGEQLAHLMDFSDKTGVGGGGMLWEEPRPCVSVVDVRCQQKPRLSETRGLVEITGKVVLFSVARPSAEDKWDDTSSPGSETTTDRSGRGRS